MGIKNKLREEKQAHDMMLVLFNDADTLGKGFITKEEFNDVLKDPRVRTWLAAMEFSPHNVDQLFELIHEADDDKIKFEELLQGFALYRGAARSMDLHALTHKVERMRK